MHETDYSEGLDNPVIEEEKRFDENGNVIEYKTYTKTGKLKKWFVYEYTQEGDIQQEKEFDAKERLIHKVVYIYQDGLRKEKLYYDGKERLLKKKTYDYTYQ